MTTTVTPLSKADLAAWWAANMYDDIQDMETALAYHILEDFKEDEAFYKEQLEAYTEIMSEV